MENKIENKTISIVDLIRYFLFYWKWIVLSVIVFVGFFYYQYSTAELVYRQTQTVMIKTPSNSKGTSITRAGATFNTVNIANEILQLKSKELMRRTIDRSHATVSYSEKNRLRYEELFTDSPVLLELDSSYLEKSFSFELEVLKNNEVKLYKFNGNPDSPSILAKLNTVVKTPYGSFSIASNSKNGNNEGRKIVVKKTSLTNLVGYFLGNLSISQMGDDAYLLQVSLDDFSPKRAAAILSNLVVVYNEFTLEDKNAIAVNTAAFIRERINIIEQELGDVEQDIQGIKTSNDASLIGGGEKFLSDIQKYESQVEETEASMKLMQMMQDYVIKAFKGGTLIPSNTGLVEENVEKMISNYNSLLLRRNRLAGDSNSSNPVVLDLNTSLDAMEDEITRTIKNNIQGLRIRLKGYRDEASLAKSKVVKLPEQERILLSVERQQKVKENLYLFLLNKREENALNQAMTDDSIRLIDSASGVSTPIAPNKLKKVGFGFLIGLLLPILILFVRLLFDTKVRNRADIVKTLTVPYLGDIPFNKTDNKSQSSILVSPTGRDQLTEAFRILRTNISFMSFNNKPPQVISFTSSSIGAGKTFNVINLVATLSYLNKRIVVVDLDLRKGTLTKRLGVSASKGVSHYLSNNSISLNEVIYSTDINHNVDVVPIGMVAPNPVELLLSNRLDQLIAELKARYDYVVLDTVPIEIIADAYIIDRVSDLTVFVIRSGKIDKRQLPEIEDVYKNKKLNNMAIILNGVSKNAKGYGYGYGYTYGYDVDRKTSFLSKIKSIFK